ncbi:collagen-like protein [Waterburya agarophytonicola K14]|uniref:Collagen-like protein n=1 Tax=Waterburya agarophytonicola KI4 TaxID=2874699 RepID=A0A964BQI4_9CYAN|nr:collagen-like protein [Waterburya agarophytonicola]MCC0176618.1 collagen-like protein [Waterburya agarophytonicola KI4]
MQVRFISKVSLFIAVLALPQLIPSASTSQPWLCSSVLAADNKPLGESGDSGEAGEKGVNGRNSDNLTVFADGSPMTLDLSGGNGAPGQQGVEGYDAFCDRQSTKNVGKDLRGADGGSGGDGGDGGIGGNGGSLTVYTTEKEHLKQIHVIAAGGAGGAPGKAGEGGEGCECDRPYWNEETCFGDPGSPDYSCTTQEFQCTDGYSGRKGRTGRKGRDGKDGILTLINLDKTLAPDLPEVTAPISELKGRGFTLSRNIWQIKDDATSLFAPGSIIASKYKELVARHEHSVLVVWDAPQPVENFDDKQITLSLKGEDEASIFLPEDLWLETKTVKRDNVSELFVFNAVRKKEVDDLTIDGLFGQGLGLELDIFDEAEQSNLVGTDFSLKYRVGEKSEDKNFFGGSSTIYKTKFEGSIPSEAIAQKGNLFTLQLGKLPIPPEHLKPGLEVEIEVMAKRSLGENSQVQQLSTRTTIEQPQPNSSVP